MNINNDREKLFSKLYNFEYVYINFDRNNVYSDFNIGDLYMISKYMQKLNSEKYKKPPFSSVKLICKNNSQKKGGSYDQRSRIYYYRIEKNARKNDNFIYSSLK